MDSSTSAPAPTTTCPCSYQDVGFLIVPVDDGLFQGIIQGGYQTPPCFTMGEVLAEVRNTIMQGQGEH